MRSPPMSSRHSRQALGLLSLVLAGCPSASVPPPAVPDAPKQAREIDLGHLLLHPVGKPTPTATGR